MKQPPRNPGHFGLYVKLEPFVGRGYNEVYWSVEDDFVPLLSVTNFSDVPDVIVISVTQAGAIMELAREAVPPHGTVTINVRERVAILRRTAPVNRDYGGMYIARLAVSPTAPDTPRPRSTPHPPQTECA